MSYEFLEHPSDIIILAKNETFEKTLEDVAEGMFTQMGSDEADESESFDIEFSEKTDEQLVVQLLTQIIAECETLPLTPKRMQVLSYNVSSDQFRVLVRVYGKKTVPENIIKAVTYNSLRIEKKDVWEMQVLFDI
jgi:SHS2 domain-containing protein